MEILFKFASSIHFKSSIMKKLALLIVVTLFSIGAFAQDRGEKFVDFAGCSWFGNTKSKASNGHQYATSNVPSNTYFGFETSFGYFVAKRFVLGLGVGIGYSEVPDRQENSEWLFVKTSALWLKPYLSYYVKLADKFYYKPEIGAALEMGNSKYHETQYLTEEYPYKSLGFYVNYFALEYRVSQHFAIDATVGQLNRSQSKMDIGVSGTTVTTKQWHFDFNSCEVATKIYF